MRAKILVIEDNPANLELMTYLLKAFGHETITATSGEEGLVLVERERPDLIICDIQMPSLDGYGVAAYLKRDPQFKHIPLIAVTSFAMVGDREKTLSAGFDGYIAKPIEPETFVVDIEYFLYEVKRREGLLPQEPTE